MKKLFFTFLFILIGVGLLLSVMDINGDYAAEKIIWSINQQFSKIARDPQAAPAAAFDRIIKQYDQFIKKYPGTHFEPVAQIHKGQVYFTRKDYSNARQVWEGLLSRKDFPASVAVIALNYIARSYTIEKNYDRVLEVYDRAIKDYPLTGFGLQAPLLKAVIYNYQKDVSSKEKALNDAAIYYKELIKKYPNSEADFLSRRYLTDTYLGSGRWQEALEVLKDLLMNFPDPRFLTRASSRWVIIRINGAAQKLNDLQLAVNIYKEFIRRYPQHPLNKLLVALIKDINTPKDSKKLESKS